MVSLVQTTLGTVLGPLVAEQAALRQTVERQADHLVSMAETIGELRAEDRALVARTAPETAEPTTGDTRVARFRTWAPWVLGVLAIVAVILAWLPWATLSSATLVILLLVVPTVLLCG
jgi:hypothetical protein